MAKEKTVLSVVSDDISEAATIAAELKQRTLAKRSVAEAMRGKAAKAHFAELRARIAEDWAELRKLQPQARLVLQSALDVLNSDTVISPQDRAGLERCVNQLRGAGNGMHGQACEDAIAELDNVGDDSRRWPTEKRYRGTLANLGDALEMMSRITSALKRIGASAIVRTRTETEPHPIAAYDTHISGQDPLRKGTSKKTITNIPRD